MSDQHYDPEILRAMHALLPRAGVPILSALVDQDLCTADLIGRAGLTPTSVRYGLRRLVSAGLVTIPRCNAAIDGRKKIYRITDVGRSVITAIGGDHRV